MTNPALDALIESLRPTDRGMTIYELELRDQLRTALSNAPQVPSDDSVAELMTHALGGYKIQQGIFGDTAARIILRELRKNGLRITKITAAPNGGG